MKTADFISNNEPALMYAYVSPSKPVQMAKLLRLFGYTNRSLSDKTNTQYRKRRLRLKGYVVN
ncbi:hypothetical protein VPHK404_0034 [Vibrio phage K404]